ncbi:MAG: type II toxin-antitoxin system Phd/YefM family antitoxin [Defluviitaleaceae bacterium]|nr:type II toxin-antitoxin system Phd/YefM family antitoxin [Defluviitaleaceae bacterium]
MLKDYVINPEKTQTSVSIARFDKGEASKIFEEVEQEGKKIVFRNDTPVCILLSPQKYEDLMELMSDLLIEEEVEKRLENPMPTTSFEEILAQEGMTLEDLDALPEAVFGVDFE